MTRRHAFLTPLLVATLGAGAALPAMAFEDDSLTIWMGDNKGPEGIREVADRFTADTGIAIDIVHPDNLTDRFQQAAGSGQGPDIVIWAHDRMGEWAQSGLLKRVAPGDAYRERYFDFTWDAVVWNGETYGYPISVESLGLIYNKALVKTPPESFAELAELDAELEQEGKKAILFDYGEPYYGWTLLAANGGYPFRRTEGGYDVDDIGVNNAGALAGAEHLQELIESGVLPEGTDYSMMDTRFNRGEVAAMISGPWAWGNLDKSGIDYGVTLLPRVGDERAKPMFGVMTAMINSASPNDFLATEFLESYLLSEQGLRTFNSDGSLGAVAHKAYQKDLASDPRIAATLENAELGVPMPNIPEMGAFWSAMEPALQNIGSGRQAPQAALDAAAERIHNAIQ
ncbi:maltose/maltodextrin ABC transporter substrate-binding protein MalE [Halomonas organivorans]|uniref:Maltodextrin-binding protein n=1 Tax=Halomonas organivorans TaxID=257772 RepID=A0A7W5BWL7_9GAMM|nr:maltose/maltodextrin ABC transporter substrate-binding protein MalE [Halomonas organivorans]MBB3139438.1 maltose/maltodextrin transport system substrate-binding protein [Halomonas organivorans]